MDAPELKRKIVVVSLLIVTVLSAMALTQYHLTRMLWNPLNVESEEHVVMSQRVHKYEKLVMKGVNALLWVAIAGIAYMTAKIVFGTTESQYQGVCVAVNGAMRCFPDAN